MYNTLLHRLVIMSGFAVALGCFIWNFYSSGDLFYSAFVSLCVLFAASTVFLIAIQTVAKVLFKYLHEKRNLQKATQPEIKKK